VRVGVLLVGDGLEPRGAVAVLATDEHRDVAHDGRVRAPVPVLLTRWGPDSVTGTEAQHAAVAIDDQTLALSAVERLTKSMRVPVGAGARGETNETGNQA